MNLSLPLEQLVFLPLKFIHFRSVCQPVFCGSEGNTCETIHLISKNVCNKQALANMPKTQSLSEKPPSFQPWQMIIIIRKAISIPNTHWINDFICSRKLES